MELLQHYAKDPEMMFRFFVFNGNRKIGDLELTQKAIDAVKIYTANYELVDYSSNVRDTWNSIAACDCIFSVRLHAGIFAHFANRPFILVEYHKKSTDFLDEIGYAENRRLGDMNLSLEESINRTNYVLNNYAEMKLADRALLTKKAMLSFTHEKIVKQYV